MLVTTCGWRTGVSAEESKTTRKVRILSRRTAARIRQIQEHAHSEIALRWNLRKLDAREDPLTRCVAVNDRGKILRREFCLFRKWLGDTNSSFVSQTHALFDFESDI